MAVIEVGEVYQINNNRDEYITVREIVGDVITTIFYRGDSQGTICTNWPLRSMIACVDRGERFRVR
jgi:hypothetical protein